MEFDKNLEDKKLVFVIASEGFRDIEYSKPREILQEHGVKIFVASDKEGMAKGADGLLVKVDFLINNIDESLYDGIVFVGGPGSLAHLDNEESYKVIKKFFDSKKLVASICAAGAILAKAGILVDKKATCWTSESDESLKNILEEKGASFIKSNVVINENVITSPGPYAAEDFGKAIVDYLQK